MTAYSSGRSASRWYAPAVCSEPSRAAGSDAREHCGSCWPGAVVWATSTAAHRIRSGCAERKTPTACAPVALSPGTHCHQRRRPHMNRTSSARVSTPAPASAPAVRGVSQWPTASAGRGVGTFVTCSTWGATTTCAAHRVQTAAEAVKSGVRSPALPRGSAGDELPADVGDHAERGLAVAAGVGKVMRDGLARGKPFMLGAQCGELQEVGQGSGRSSGRSVPRSTRWDRDGLHGTSLGRGKGICDKADHYRNGHPELTS
ncbi:hypothetical protein LMG28688_05852 [Paraburkholderia caffeinitolerans]|uniref:Uncharacterized protein n=1 Tax=Paraburkholderia caffeinitolerans TaxID=1723730 RepID=A0A6J5GSD5_9BURK|nr:hypothetical protein LMG28688_05852 [Paraburkholderia caffeinitolerans]